MKIPTSRIIRALVATMGLALLGPCIGSSPQAAEVQVGRYSTLPAMPTAAQVDLLATIIIVTFPARIQTIGEAVNYLLQRSGYRLAPLLARVPEAEILLALKLPAVHRNLGPVTLRLALETLAGKPFHLVRDPVRRLISFELHPSATHTALTIGNHKLKGPHYGE